MEPLQNVALLRCATELVEDRDNQQPRCAFKQPGRNHQHERKTKNPAIGTKILNESAEFLHLLVRDSVNTVRFARMQQKSDYRRRKRKGSRKASLYLSGVFFNETLLPT